MPDAARGGFAKEVGRALELLQRAARERAAHGAHSTALHRMMPELRAMLDGLATRVGALQLDVGERAFRFREADVEEASLGDSLAPLFHRDGVRRIELAPGLESAELEVLLAAAARAIAYKGMGDDAGSYLARHSLLHARFTIAAAGEPGREELEGVLGELFGAGSASAVAKTLASLEAGGACHPVRVLGARTAYAGELEDEAAAENERSLSLRALDCALEASRAPLPEADARALLAGIGARLEAALATGELQTAARIIEALPEDADVSEARARTLASIAALIPGTADPEARRSLSELLLKLGAGETERARAMLESGHPFVIDEGIYLLARIGTPEARALIAGLENHPRAETRRALAEQVGAFPEDEAAELGGRLLTDADLGVRAAVARALAAMGGFAAAKLLDEQAQRLESEALPFELKQVMLEAYAVANQTNALRLLAAYAGKAEGLLAKKEVEDLSVAAVTAMGKVLTQKSVALLKNACVVRNKRVREAARETLERMRGGSA